MRIEEVEAFVVGLSLIREVQSAGLRHADKTTVFVKVRTDTGSGWGECAAYPGAREPDPSIDAVEPGAIDAVAARLVAAVSAGSCSSALAAASACDPRSVAEQTVAAALEMALLDVELRSDRRPLADVVGADRREVETGSLVGIPERRDLGPFLAEVQAALEAGARRLRVKIEPGWDHRPLEALRERHGDLLIQADANGSYGRSSLPALHRLDAYGLRCLEQPFAPDDLEGHRRLADAMATPICLDESLWSLAQVHRALAAGACRVACLKPGRLGGVAATVAAAEACAAAGVDCFMGGFFESGLGRSVNAAVAGRPEFTLPGDLSDPAGYLVENPFSYLEIDDGLVRLSTSPGVGSDPLVEVLEGRTLRSRRLHVGA